MYKTSTLSSEEGDAIGLLLGRSTQSSMIGASAFVNALKARTAEVMLKRGVEPIRLTSRHFVKSDEEAQARLGGPRHVVTVDRRGRRHSSTDAGCGGGPGYDYLLTVGTPRLFGEGSSDEEVNAIWRKNPARWLVPNI